MKRAGESTPTAGRQNKHFILGLDGLRALAVISVIFYHLFPSVIRGGYLGVDIFFVISGFLITTLLINEYRQTGRIAFKQFWLRRARRLLPALILTILIISSLIFFIRGDSMVGLGQQITGALTFSSNWVEVLQGTNYFDAIRTHLFLNFWSLGVEEQFYVVWPLLVAVIIGVIKKPAVGLFVTGGLTLLSSWWMYFLFSHDVALSRIYYGTDTHLFGIMIGAFLAFLTLSLQENEPMRRLSQPFWQLQGRVFPHFIGIGALLALGVFLAVLPDQSALAYSGGMLGACVCTAIVLAVTMGTRGPLRTLFTWRPLQWIGIRSYGIYLWHWPLLVVLTALLPARFSWLLSLCVAVLTITIAAVSYRYIEMPVRQQGFRSTLKKAIKRRYVFVDQLPFTTHIRPHSASLAVAMLILFTVMAVSTAPTKTSAQLNIEAGQRLLAHQQAVLVQKTKQHQQMLHDGGSISAIGDSVMLAAAPMLEEKYPGIYINAEVSRSLTRGGLATVAELKAAHQLRPVVIIGLGTNGPYGAGKLEELLDQLKGYEVVVVSAHADRQWIGPNNDELNKVVKQYRQVAIAQWDQTIAPHPELLSDDGIHPFGDGETLYANCIAEALKQLE